MSVHALAFGRNEDEYITIGPTKEKESVRPLVCKNCGAPLTRGVDQCEYCGTVYSGTNIKKCSAFKEKQTNFSCITESPEALAKWVCEITDFCDRGCSHCPIQKECLYDADGAGNRENEEMLVEWFKQESKDE